MSFISRRLKKARLGDKMEAVTTATGIKRRVERRKGGPCKRCKKVKDIMNGMEVE